MQESLVTHLSRGQKVKTMHSNANRVTTRSTHQPLHYKTISSGAHHHLKSMLLLKWGTSFEKPIKTIRLANKQPWFLTSTKRFFGPLFSTQNVDWILINNCWQRHHCCSSSSWISVWNFEETRSWGGGWKINHAEWCNYRLSALLARFLRVSKTAWKMVKFCSLTSIKIPKAQS